MNKWLLPNLTTLLSIICFGFNATSQTIISKDNKFGLMNTDGSAILPLEYSEVRELTLYDYYKTGIFYYKKDKKSGLYNGATKTNTGLVIDSLVQGHNKGTYIFRIGDLWGMIIEPEIYHFDWVMPKYKHIIPYSNGLNPFTPDPYAMDRIFKGYSVSMDSLWGYASYLEDKLIIRMNYRNRVEKYERTSGTVYASYDKKSNGGLLIDPTTQANIRVSDIVMTKEIGDYYLDDHFIGDDLYLTIQHLPTGRKVLDQKMDVFELSPLYFRYISDDIIEVQGEGKRKNKSRQEDQLYVWYNVTNGTEILLMSFPNCRQPEYSFDNDPTAVWSHVTCGAGKSKIIGHIVDGKFVKD